MLTRNWRNSMAVLKRTLAFLLVLTIILSMGEGLAFAADAPADDTSAVEEVAEEEAPPVVDAEEEQSDAPAPEQTPEESEDADPDGDLQTPEESDAPEAPEPEDDPLPEEPSEEDMLAIAAASVEPLSLERKSWPWTEPGNDIVEILGGGKYLITGGSFYYSDNGLWLESGGSQTKLASGNAENLNLSGGWLYYTVNDTLWRINPTGGTPESVYTADDYIWMLYVMGQELRYIAGGAAWSYDMQTGTLEALEAPSGLKKLIPTPYGNLYLTGELFNYTLWAETTQLATGIDSAYPDGDWLVVVNAAGTWQTPLADLFEGSINLTDYNLHQAELTAAYTGLSDEAQLENEAAFMDSDEYAVMQTALESGADNNNGIATISISHVRTKTLTTNQQNMVMRAQQMSEVVWTALEWRYSWGGNDDSYVSANYNGNAKVTATDGTVTRG